MTRPLTKIGCGIEAGWVGVVLGVVVLGIEVVRPPVPPGVPVLPVPPEVDPPVLDEGGAGAPLVCPVRPVGIIRPTAVAVVITLTRIFEVMPASKLMPSLSHHNCVTGEYPM